jgi:hypothetical protein
MAKSIPVFINTGRNRVLAMPVAVRKAAAMEEVKMLLVPQALRRAIWDREIPLSLVSEEMAERYLDITPPVLYLLVPDLHSVIQEIEQSYVIGNDFSAASASCVVIERLLNRARIDLHEHHKVIKELWGKGATDGWGQNIKALREWNYLDDSFASELSSIYHDIRCTYLHSGPIKSLREDARRAVNAAYKLMTMFIGFPEDLFELVGGGPKCKNENDPRFLKFYKPYF